jgi:hypothetical protein
MGQAHEFLKRRFAATQRVAGTDTTKPPFYCRCSQMINPGKSFGSSIADTVLPACTAKLAFGSRLN